MKKLVLSILAMAFTMTAFSQGINLLYHNAPVGDTLNFYCTNMEDENQLDLIVQNNTSDSVYLRVVKDVVSELDGSYNTFCMGNCYDPSVTVSPITLNLAPGESSTPSTLHFIYYPGNQYGTTTVVYSFTDERSESATVVVNYITLSEGIDNHVVNAKAFNAYPNPATSQVTVQYDLSNWQPGDKSRLVVTSLVGNQVRAANLSGATGRATLDISDLVAGIYFYSLEVNGQVVTTKKLIVK